MHCHRNSNVYDGFGRLASSSTNMGGTARTLSYSYDANGNRTAIKHPDEISFTTLYDGLNRPYLSSGPAGAIRLVLYLPWGPVGGIYTPANHSYLVYDRIGRPESMDHFLTGGDVHWAYGHNPANQLVSVDRDNDAYAWGGHYAVNRAYATNGLNQYSAPGGTSFTYDLNGNLTSDGANAYVYDVENRLVSASGLHNATLAYDPLGRLWQVTVPAAGGGTTTTQFLYDGDALVAEYNGAGAVTHRYAHWVGADVPMIAYDGADLSTPHYLFADHQGSIVALANGSGALAGINSYDEYGIPAATNQGRFQYTGQAWLSELGLYYYKARIYSPTLGRFMQTDPIGYQGGINLYDYVGDDPVGRTDPTGLYVCVGSGDNCAAVRAGLAIIRDASHSRELTSSQRAALARVVNFYGREGDRSVRISFTDRGVEHTVPGERATISVTLSPGFARLYDSYRGRAGEISGLAGLRPEASRAAILAHAGQHGIDERAAGYVIPSDRVALERNAYSTQSYLEKATGNHSANGLWDPRWGADADARRRAAVEYDAHHWGD